jgi:hypothetical protein
MTDVMTETFTRDEVTALVHMLVSGIRPGAVDDRVYSLEEVAERTHWSLDTLKADCAAEPPRIKHTKRGRQRGMTSSQIADAIREHTIGAPFGDQLAALVHSSAGQVRPGNRHRRRVA